ncbi:major ampullate gland peroxidase, partial [Trichonephila inaurata madagascariensis]
MSNCLERRRLRRMDHLQHCAVQFPRCLQGEYFDGHLFQDASYEGFEDFRNSMTGGPLPEPRDITLNIFQSANRPSTASFMFTYYGQTLAHDLSRAIPTDQDLPCCAPENEKHPVCINIRVRKDDPFFSTYNKTCLFLHRTQLCSSCNVEKREQKNAVTATLDSSQIYGSDDDTASTIRAKDGTGKLIFRRTEHGDLLPFDKNPQNLFCSAEIRSRCLKS